MMTLFTSTRAFRGHDGIAQRNALLSWSRLLPRCEIVIFGDEPGVSEAVNSIGAVHVPDVEMSAHGTPLLSDMFATVQRVGRHDLFCFAAPDIIFLSNLTEQIERHRSDLGDDFLLAGSTWKIGTGGPIAFDVNWEPLLRWQVNRRGRRSADAGFDYCIYPRGRYIDSPPFIVGRPGWDAWIISSSHKAKTRLIDASRVITAVHQVPDHSPVSNIQRSSQEDPEADHNQRLIRDMPGSDDHRGLDLRSAGWLLDPSGLVAKRSFSRPWTEGFDRLLHTRLCRAWRMGGMGDGVGLDLLKRRTLSALKRILGRGKNDAEAALPDPDPWPAADLPVPATDRVNTPPLSQQHDDPLISVVICTYNRAELLGDCLDSLVRQDEGGFEIIVIDNNSTDDTPSVVENFTDRDVPVRYIFEPQQGLSPARNRGWREARGRYVAYLDDECRTTKDWIGNMTASIQTHEPEMLGGPYDACFDGPPPDWYRRPYFSTVWKGSRRRAIGPKEFLAGGNMVIRRDVFDRVDPFDPKLGMKGNTVAYAEETAFQSQLLKVMPDAQRIYDPSITVDHLVRDNKLGIRDLLVQCIAAGRSGWRMAVATDDTLLEDKTQTRGLSRNLAVTATTLAWQLLIGLPFRKRSLYPYPQNFLREVPARSASRLGHLLEQRRYRKRPLAG